MFLFRHQPLIMDMKTIANTIQNQIQSPSKWDEKREKMNRGRGFRWEIAGGNVCIPPPSSADINHFHISPAAVTTDKHWQKMKKKKLFRFFQGGRQGFGLRKNSNVLAWVWMWADALTLWLIAIGGKKRGWRKDLGPAMQCYSGCQCIGVDAIKEKRL